MKLIWSERARNDLIQIGEFIARNAPENARRHIQILLDRAAQSALLPQSGRIVPEFQDENLRELIQGNYRIVYEVAEKKKTVTIITVFEAHRLIQEPPLMGFAQIEYGSDIMAPISAEENFDLKNLEPKKKSKKSRKRS